MREAFLYKFARYPNDEKLASEMTNAAFRLEKKLADFSIDSLELSDYNRRYFGGYIKTEENRVINLQKYCYILSWVLSGVDKCNEDIVFLDHGGGHGMMSLLAKEYGIGTVIHNDIYPVSSVDAKKIAVSLGIEADVYIAGEIDDVIDYLNVSAKQCDAVASYDVIEHVYDIHGFLEKLPQLSNENLNVFMASSANERNPRINREIKAMHRKFELDDRAPKFGRKPTDTTRAIIELRKEIIERYSQDLAEEELDLLAQLTRGLMVDDIHAVLDNYISSKVYPKGLVHPTNTCDPYTGNWFEHLMNPDDLADTLEQRGFKVKIMCGYYNSPNNKLIRLIKMILNVAIRVMDKRGLLLAPYFVLMGNK